MAAQLPNPAPWAARKVPPQRSGTPRTRLALRAHDDAVLGVLEVGHAHSALRVARRLERRHVDQVGQVSSAEAGGALGDDLAAAGGGGRGVKCGVREREH